MFACARCDTPPAYKAYILAYRYPGKYFDRLRRYNLSFYLQLPVVIQQRRPYLFKIMIELPAFFQFVLASHRAAPHNKTGIADFSDMPVRSLFTFIRTNKGAFPIFALTYF